MARSGTRRAPGQIALSSDRSGTAAPQPRARPKQWRQGNRLQPDDRCAWPPEAARAMPASAESLVWIRRPRAGTDCRLGPSPSPWSSGPSPPTPSPPPLRRADLGGPEPNRAAQAARTEPGGLDRCWRSARSVPVAQPGVPKRGPAGASRRTGERRVIPISVNADWYARRVGVAAAREINKIPARRPSTEESVLRRVGITTPMRVARPPASTRITGRRSITTRTPVRKCVIA
jgi:hypothetical protein